MSKHNDFSDIHASQAWSATSVTSSLPFGVPAGAAIIFLAAFLAYLPSINGGFVLDDNALLTENEHIKAPDGLYRFWCTVETKDYWPVTNTTLWIEWRLWGMNSTGYHVTNLILHIVEALLIWIILRKLSIPGAFLAAMIFSVHPVNVESVAWIAQRKNMMAMLVFLLSILWYLKAEMPSPSPQNGLYRIPSPLAPRPSHLWYWLSLAAFVLAMLSKGSVAILPVLLLGIVWWLRPLTRRDLVRTAPFFAVAVVLAAVNVWFQRHGTEAIIRAAGFTERLLGAGSVVWFYLYKALLPVDLSFVYPQWHIQAGNPFWWLPLSAALVVTAVLWRYRKGWTRPLLFAWGFFCVALAPVMGFIDVGFMQYSLVADHYQHIALVGAITPASALWSVWHQRARSETHWATTAVAVAAVGTLVFLSWRQSGLYRNEITLYQDTLEKNPACWMAHNNLSVALVETGWPTMAIEHCEQALRLKPKYPEAHYNLGLALAATGRPQEAIKHYELALQMKPNYPEAHSNLGILLAQTGQSQEAIEHFQKAVQLKSDYAVAYNNLGSALVRIGRPQEAIKHFEQALRLKPDYAKAHFNLGNAFKAMNQYQQAIDHYQQALRLQPDYIEVHNNLGLALLETDRPREAIEHCRQALRLKPDYTEAYYNLALAYAKLHRPSQTIITAQKAIDLAQSQGKKALAKEIEDWLNSYYAGLSDAPASRETASPPP